MNTQIAGDDSRWEVLRPASGQSGPDPESDGRPRGGLPRESRVRALPWPLCPHPVQQSRLQRVKQVSVCSYPHKLHPKNCTARETCACRNVTLSPFRPSLYSNLVSNELSKWVFVVTPQIHYPPQTTPQKLCRERAMCVLSRDPLTHTSYSNLVSNELSKWMFLVFLQHPKNCAAREWVLLVCPLYPKNCAALCELAVMWPFRQSRYSNLVSNELSKWVLLVLHLHPK